MSPLRTTALTALLAAALAAAVLVPGGGAAAVPPAAQAAPPLLLLDDAAHGRTVHVVPGQALRVELAAAEQRWLGLERGTPRLQVTGYDVDASGLAAGLLALAPGGPQELRATAGSRTWSVQVVVDPGEPQPARTCAPRPTASASPTATAVPSATGSPQPDGLSLGAASDGTRPRVQVGAPVNVTLDDCAAPYGPVTVVGGEVLRRDSAGSSVVDGQAEADLVPASPGTATLEAERDTPCAARGGASCPPPWRVVVDVEPAPTPAPCEVVLDGPASVPSGGTAVLTGTARPGEQVEVLFRARGASAFTVRRVLQAGPDGAFSTSYAALDDQRWLARTGGCSSAAGLTQVQPTVAGPPQVRRGAAARLVVRAAPGARVGVAFRRAGTSRYVPGRSGTAGSDGRFVTTFRPDVDHAYVATSLGRTSAPAVTRAR